MSLFDVSNWKIMPKLMGMVGIIIIPITAIIFAFYIPEVKEELYKEKEGKIKNVVETVYGVIQALDEKVKSGKITLDSAKQIAIHQVSITRYDEKEYIFICDMEPKIVINPLRKNMTGKNVADLKDADGLKIYLEFTRIAREKGEGSLQYRQLKPGDETPYPKITYVKYFKEWDWVIGTGIYIDSVEKDISKLRNRIIIMFVIVVLISLLVTYFLALKISGNLKKLEKAAVDLTNGQYNVNVVVESGDEIGGLSHSFNLMAEKIKNSIIEIQGHEKAAVQATQEAKKAQSGAEEQQRYLEERVNIIREEMRKFSNGDLTVSLPREEHPIIGKLFEAFNESVARVRDILDRVNQAVMATSSSAAEISSSAEEMSAGSHNQTIQIQEVASATEEMTRTILDNTRNASLSADTARKAGLIAKEGGNVVEETIKGMNNIAKVVLEAAARIEKLGVSSKQIGEIIQVIDEIADQTNLLALNAAIEAARAGEQGRGFAVVADEVRKLAERTTKATKEIADMIKSIQSDTKEAVEAMNKGTSEVEVGKQKANKAGEELGKIIVETEHVSDLVSQVAAASEEQSATSEDIARNIESINAVVRESAAGIQQIATATEDLNRLTNTLRDLILQFKIN